MFQIISKSRYYVIIFKADFIYARLCNIIIYQAKKAGMRQEINRME